MPTFCSLAFLFLDHNYCLLFVPMYADEDGEMAEDSKELTKKDIHTLNEQKRRDMIKVRAC